MSVNVQWEATDCVKIALFLRLTVRTYYRTTVLKWNNLKRSITFKIISWIIKVFSDLFKNGLCTAWDFQV